MILSTKRSAPACELIIDGGRRHLYAVTLNPSIGEPMGHATELPVHAAGFNDGSASLSPDMCTLYFSSDRAGSWDIYETRRR
jgi:hypothetical protein